ncbi:helix-turn-helix domain-containing protein [Streptomyces hygroscopicus]|uniref:helix-turn-helix domain-containing protein n=1 Tax=Streptomyces hygroscopicus TaxID=1912 RepID=UPI00099F2031|nr:helix-turn-helix domain-containing protein [Streptomyces hygroscopicus]
MSDVTGATAANGRLLQRLRKEAGLSLLRLAELTHYNKGHLSKVENGRKPMSMELAQVCDQVLGTRGALTEHAYATAARSRGDRLPLAQLPAAPRHLHGRTRAMARLERLLLGRSGAPGGVPVVCVDGMPGVGKTALALRCAHAVAHRFPDGTLFANLRGDDRPLEPGDVLGSFLRALGAHPDRIPDDQQERAAMYRSLLSGRSVLVVLDNATASAQVQPLLPGSEGCAVVVTSRQHLTGLLVSPAQATRLTLSPLALPDAVDLLRSVIGDQRADAEPTALAGVAMRCGSVPLALRIAAVWLAAHPRLSIADFNRYLTVDTGRLALLCAGDDEMQAIQGTFPEQRGRAGSRSSGCSDCRDCADAHGGGPEPVVVAG